MEIEKLVVGQLQTNCYLVWDRDSQDAVIIDPGDDADYIQRRIQDLGLKPLFVLATHGHFDHVLAVNELKLTYGIPFYLHQKDLVLLKNAQKSAQYWLGIRVDQPPEVDEFLKEGDLIEFGKEKLKVIESPGHSPGGVVFYDRGILFSGDILFSHGVGRTDLSYSSPIQLENSLKRIFKLPSDTTVYPGHGPETKIGEERIPKPTSGVC